MSEIEESPFGHIQEPKKRAYLAALVETGGNKVRAAHAAGINPSTPYTRQWKEDEEFQKALELAISYAADVLEAEAIRRAHDGVEEPVGWYKGEPGGVVTKYSDTLLIFLMKGANPTKYVERHQLTGADGGPIETRITRRIIDPKHPEEDPTDDE